MYYILLTAQQAATQAASAAQEATTQAPSNDIIGIGGIIATLLVGIVTCLVTWKLTMKSIKQLKISYNIQVFPILSNSVTQNTDINLDDLKIQYKDKELLNPCLLALEIVNIGNEAINEPPIKIRNDEDIEIIPGYFEDIPAGYENLWSFDITSPHSCNILLKHINPKQVVKTRFFLDNLPQKKIIFECPMQNVQTQEVAYNNANTTNKITVSSKSNFILMAITALLFISMQQWSYYISEFIWFTRCKAQPIQNEVEQGTDSINFSTDTITITALPDENGDIRLFGETIDKDFKCKDTWFKSVPPVPDES